MKLWTGPFCLDPETGRVHEGDRLIPLAPKPFETLLYLASRPTRVVSKSELMEHIWPGTFVTDDVSRMRRSGGCARCSSRCSNARVCSSSA